MEDRAKRYEKIEFLGEGQVKLNIDYDYLLENMHSISLNVIYTQNCELKLK